MPELSGPEKRRKEEAELRLSLAIAYSRYREDGSKMEDFAIALKRLDDFLTEKKASDASNRKLI